MDEQGQNAFRAYVADCSTGLLRTAYLLTGDRHEAEDLVQTALASTYLAWDRIRDPKALDSYVRRVMINTQRSWWRRPAHRFTAVSLLPDRGGGRDVGEDLALHDALWTALAGLPRRQRAVLVLRYYEDLSEAEAAALLNVSVGTVKSSTSRALARLRGAAGLHSFAASDRTALPLDGVAT